MKSQSFIFVACLAMVTICFVRLAGATSIPVNDPSFEFGYGSDPTTGWVNALGGSWGIFNPAGSNLLTPPATDGTDVAFGNGGTAYQILAHQVAVGVYTIQVDVGHRSDGLYAIFVLSVSSTNPIGNQSVDMGSFSLASAPPLGGWSTLTASIVITNGSPAIGGNLQLNLNSPGIQVVLDNLRVDFVPGVVPALAVLTNALVVNGANFQFTVSGSGTQIVQVNTNLTTQSGWLAIHTNTAPFVFTDTNALHLSRERFYRLVAAPTGSTAGVVIQSIQPDFGSFAGGTLVTVAGSNFNGATQAVWGGVPVPINVAGGGNSFTLVTPPHALGPVILSVTNGVGQGTTSGAPFSYVALLHAGRTITADGQGADWTNGCLLAEELTPSNWTTNNSLQKLYAAYDTQHLYLAVKGVVENNNVLSIYLDRDFGASTGVSNLSTLSDNIGILDAALSNGLNASGISGFGVEYGIGTYGMRSVTTSSNYPATDYAGMRDLASNPANFGWAVDTGGNSLVTLAAGTGAGSLIEVAIPWNYIYPSGIPTSGANLAIFARISSGDGAYFSNQCLPPGDELNAQTVQQVATLKIR